MTDKEWLKALVFIAEYLGSGATTKEIETLKELMKAELNEYYCYKHSR